MTSNADPGATLASAWALKHRCYEAWTSDPALAVSVAAELAALPTDTLAAPEALQVRALADWTLGIACLGQGQMADAVGAFDRADAALTLAGEPDAAAQTQVPKIMALSLLGLPEQATACAEAAQTRLLALGNVAAASRVSLNLGSLLLRRDEYSASAQHYRRAAVLFARQGDLLHSVLADIGLASALSSLGDFDEALRIYARVRMRAGSHSLGQPLAMVDESVALLELARGRYSDALASMESARRRYEALAMPHALAIAEKQLADAYLDLRLLPEALALFDAAVSKFDSLGLPEEKAWALAQRGRTQSLLDRPGAAAQAFTAAAALFGESRHAVGLASVGLAQAELALAHGDATAALHHTQLAATGFAQAGQADGLARAQVLQAQALWQCGQAKEAEQAFAHTLTIAQQRQQLQVQVRCLTGQGMAAWARGQVVEAEVALEQAIALLEDQRRALPGDELRSAFLTEHLRPYQERLRLALATGDAPEVLLQLERYQARSLADRLGEPPTPHRDDDAALRQRLNWLHRHLQRLHEEGEQPQALQEERLRTEAELLERARRRRLAGGGHPNAGVAMTPFSVSALQDAMGPTDGLLVYGVLDDELFALVVRLGEVRLVRHLASWQQVLQAVQSLRFQLETLAHGQAQMQAHLAVIARRTHMRLQQLHRLVWAGLPADLNGCRRLLLVSPGPLAGVPFSALCAEGALPPLGDTCQLAMVPSARAALHGLARQPAPARTALALGEASRLPHAGHEARLVAGLYPQGQALAGPDATLGQLRAAASTADVLHLACHAQFRADNPRFSALHLLDGPLTAELAETLPLRASCTVVLSACETGLAEAGQGNEMVGLVRAFLVAGAARVLATLWPVDDAVTASFMAGFHRALVAGLAPSAALQQAQQLLRTEYPEAQHWAAFCLHGGW